MNYGQPPSTTFPSRSGGVAGASKVLSVVIILCREDDFMNRYLVYDLVREGLRGRYRKIELHVMSPLPPPMYLKQVRDLLLSNIHMGIVVRYSGHGPNTLKMLLQKLVESGNDIRVYSTHSLGNEYLEVIKQYGINPIIAGEGP
jgi:hypothetical protein